MVILALKELSILSCVHGAHIAGSDHIPVMARLGLPIVEVAGFKTKVKRVADKVCPHAGPLPGGSVADLYPTLLHVHAENAGMRLTEERLELLVAKSRKLFLVYLREAEYEVLKDARVHGACGVDDCATRSVELMRSTGAECYFAEVLKYYQQRIQGGGLRPIVDGQLLNKVLIRDTDVSGVAEGQVLGQWSVGGGLVVSHFFSGMFSESERVGWHVVKKELCSLSRGLKRALPYIITAPEGEVHGDASYLRGMINNPVNADMVMRCSVYLLKEDYGEDEEIALIMGFLDLLGFPEGVDVKRRLQIQRKAANFFLADGVLFMRSRDGLAKRVVVRRDEQVLLICAVHEGDGGHSAKGATYLKLRLRYWWKLMKTDVDVFVAGCEDCQRLSFKKELEPLRPSLMLFLVWYGALL
ncbi:hypothetical protein HDU98_005204 [Podochytrium sp. JEL0797]|nr:hypothetical protein HDU98_005204 [Podochytrium sp. JEL0797]